jgi:hypothetical protein
MKFISTLPLIALFGVAAVSAAPAAPAGPSSSTVDQNPCEYFGMKKEWCVDRNLRPELMAHLQSYSISNHAPASKRDDFTDAHDNAEFSKRRILDVRSDSEPAFEKRYYWTNKYL